MGRIAVQRVVERVQVVIKVQAHERLICILRVDAFPPNPAVRIQAVLFGQRVEPPVVLIAGVLVFQRAVVLLEPRFHLVIGEHFFRITLPRLPLRADFPECIARVFSVAVAESGMAVIWRTAFQRLTVRQILEAMPDFVRNHRPDRLARRGRNPQRPDAVVVPRPRRDPIRRIQQVDLQLAAAGQGFIRHVQPLHVLRVEQLRLFQQIRCIHPHLRRGVQRILAEPRLPEQQEVFAFGAPGKAPAAFGIVVVHRRVFLRLIEARMILRQRRRGHHQQNQRQRQQSPDFHILIQTIPSAAHPADAAACRRRASARPPASRRPIAGRS